jgi:hypothetical protein
MRIDELALVATLWTRWCHSGRTNMYPSGQWKGFWVQEEWGRQEMTPFFLSFEANRVTGSGRDIVGRFTFAGEYDEKTGKVLLIKEYIGRHQVLYVGNPDGEGSILGTWHIGKYHKGPFLIQPVLQKPLGDEPIQEIE